MILELSILALCLVGFFWCCCVSECTATVACNGCSGTSATLDSAEGYSIVLAGLSNDDCTDCDEFNATFLMDSTAFVFRVRASAYRQQLRLTVGRLFNYRLQRANR